jgi:hypothetical protein
MKKYIAFLFWVPKFFGCKVAKVYSGYVDMLRSEPGLGFLGMIIFTIVAFVVTALPALAIFGKGTLSAILSLLPLVGIPLHYFVVQVHRLYSIFNEERQDTFDALK